MKTLCFSYARKLWFMHENAYTAAIIPQITSYTFPAFKVWQGSTSPSFTGDYYYNRWFHYFYGIILTGPGPPDPYPPDTEWTSLKYEENKVINPKIQKNE